MSNCTCENETSIFRTKPTEACLLCAEKHFSVASSNYLKYELSGNYRQLILGELNLCNYHVMNKFDNLRILINEIIDIILYRKDDKDLLDKFSQFDNLLSNELVNYKSDDNSIKSKDIEFSVPEDSSIELSELMFSTAWRLSEECGYLNVNRSLIINELTMAQLYCYKINYDLALKIRDVRRYIQTHQLNDISSKWIEILNIYNNLGDNNG